MPYLPDLDRMLVHGALHADGPDRLRLVRHVLDPLVLPTGRLVACDPLVAPDAGAFVDTLVPGAYPVVAWVAEVLDGAGSVCDRRTAAVQLLVPGACVARWEPARTEGDAPDEELGPDGFVGYCVDSGTGCFADAGALAALARLDEAQVEAALVDAGDAGTPVPWLVRFVVDPATGAEVVALGSGWGDGVYPTFVGRDVHGTAVSFVTDFLVLPRSAPVHG